MAFPRYLSQSPSDQQTAVLSKQLVGVEQLANILINAPVKDIKDIVRTPEEDDHKPGADGFALTAPGNAYIAYPFNLELRQPPKIYGRLSTAS